MLGLLMMIAFSDGVARATERSFACFASTSDAVAVLIVGRYDRATNEPTTPVRMVGVQTGGPALSAPTLGTPAMPLTFERDELTLDYEATHDEFVVQAFGRDGARLSLRFGPDQHSLTLEPPRTGAGPSKPIVASDVDCRFDARRADDDWSWFEPNELWPY